MNVTAPEIMKVSSVNVSSVENGSVARALAKSKRDERASNEGGWCSFAVTIRQMQAWTARKSARESRAT
jgi:flavin reductase (DIM6/NTAB) family NADH-FMN oxidoreductase RutF